MSVPASAIACHICLIIGIGYQFRRSLVMTEVMKLAFADRAYWLGDPSFVKVPKGLTNAVYAKELALKIDSKHLGALEYQGELFMILKKTSSAKSNLAKIKAICGTSCEEYIDLKKAIGNK